MCTIMDIHEMYNMAYTAFSRNHIGNRGVPKHKYNTDGFIFTYVISFINVLYLFLEL